MTLEFKWTVSRARATYGYAICSLYADGRKVAACKGRGYDMAGTALGNWVARTYADRLRTLKPENHGFYGLSFHDPQYDPGKAVISANGETVEQAEAAGNSLGLARYQAIYSASSKTPTEKHTVPHIDGACGQNSVEQIMRAIGLELEFVARSSKNSIYLLRDKRQYEMGATDDERN